MEHFQIKTWRINDLEDMTNSDLEFLQKNAGNVDWSPEQYIESTDVTGRAVYYKTKSAILKFTTNNLKQETLLRIKYGDRLILESWVNCTSTHAYV